MCGSALLLSHDSSNNHMAVASKVESHSLLPMVFSKYKEREEPRTFFFRRRRSPPPAPKSNFRIHVKPSPPPMPPPQPLPPP
ncbi:hypothetical protein PanWU01x14_187800 [Parasponia andersonii]|uniref:Uncharacterized protein n=1 Tax=Parasponia andersonii TaxID=3476 RepID=A0A2P5C372_PARAD|nr:hypothetical protein PanWU01x14_187800 [Parasponia andersonii]